MVLYLLKNKKVWLVFVLLVLGYFMMDGVILGFTIWETSSGVPKNTETFAMCLTQSDVKLYGAFWCGHCQDQKEMFGEAFEFVDYVECSDPDGRQNGLCAAAGITGYPTWEFEDGERVSKVLSFKELAAKSGCTI